MPTSNNFIISADSIDTAFAHSPELRNFLVGDNHEDLDLVTIIKTGNIAAVQNVFLVHAITLGSITGAIRFWLLLCHESFLDKQKIYEALEELKNNLLLKFQSDSEIPGALENFIDHDHSEFSTLSAHLKAALQALPEIQQHSIPKIFHTMFLFLHYFQIEELRNDSSDKDRQKVGYSKIINPYALVAEHLLLGISWNIQSSLGVLNDSTGVNLEMVTRWLLAKIINRQLIVVNKYSADQVEQWKREIAQIEDPVMLSWIQDALQKIYAFFKALIYDQLDEARKIVSEFLLLGDCELMLFRMAGSKRSDKLVISKDESYRIWSSEESVEMDSIDAILALAKYAKNTLQERKEQKKKAEEEQYLAKLRVKIEALQKDWDGFLTFFSRRLENYGLLAIWSEASGGNSVQSIKIYQEWLKEKEAIETDLNSESITSNKLQRLVQRLESQRDLFRSYCVLYEFFRFDQVNRLLKKYEAKKEDLEFVWGYYERVLLRLSIADFSGIKDILALDERDDSHPANRVKSWENLIPFAKSLNEILHKLESSGLRNDELKEEIQDILDKLSESPKELEEFLKEKHYEEKMSSGEESKTPEDKKSLAERLSTALDYFQEKTDTIIKISTGFEAVFPQLTEYKSWISKVLEGYKNFKDDKKYLKKPQELYDEIGFLEEAKDKGSVDAEDIKGAQLLIKECVEQKNLFLTTFILQVKNKIREHFSSDKDREKNPLKEILEALSTLTIEKVTDAKTWITQLQAKTAVSNSSSIFSSPPPREKIKAYQDLATDIGIALYLNGFSDQMPEGIKLDNISLIEAFSPLKKYPVEGGNDDHPTISV